MDFKDVADLVVSSGNRIDNSWRYFVAINPVVIGWLISFSQPLPTDLRLGLCFVYIVASLLNLSALVREYVVFRQLVVELKSKAQEASLTKESKRLISKIELKLRLSMTIGVYIVTACVIIYLVVT